MDNRDGVRKWTREQISHPLNRIMQEGRASGLPVPFLDLLCGMCTIHQAHVAKAPRHASQEMEGSTSVDGSHRTTLVALETFPNFSFQPFSHSTSHFPASGLNLTGNEPRQLCVPISATVLASFSSLVVRASEFTSSWLLNFFGQVSMYYVSISTFSYVMCDRIVVWVLLPPIPASHVWKPIRFSSCSRVSLASSGVYSALNSSCPMYACLYQLNLYISIWSHACKGPGGCCVGIAVWVFTSQM